MSDDNPWLRQRTRTGEQYDAVYEQRAAAGEDVHGEANFIERLGVRSVLDAGCGTGRVGRELAKRGLDVAGVDLDDVMLETARTKGPDVDWRLGDLATIDLGRRFEAIVLAGNVMIFVTPGTEGIVLANLARHLERDGVIVAGFQLRPNGLGLDQYDALAGAAGLSLRDRFATWDGDPWARESDYAVSVHTNRREGSRP